MVQLGAIIVARMDSRRFPGKVLHPILGRPMLWHVAQICRQVRALEGRIIIATTTRSIDNPIARFAFDHELRIFRGDTDDVARRLSDCSRFARWDAFFRVNADSPCLQPDLLDQAAAIYTSGELDLVTNLHPRSFPYGVSVELLRASTFAQACLRFDGRNHREHATLYYYEHAQEFRIHNIANPASNTPLPSLTLDMPEDLARIEAYLANQNEQNESLGRLESVPALA